MSNEIYWKKALYQTKLSINTNSLFPLKTKIITDELYENHDFIIRSLDTSKFNKNNIYGPRQNPFCPWDEILEIFEKTKSELINFFSVLKLKLNPL